MDIPDIPEGTTKAEAALIYVRAGIPVFPCGPDKQPIGRLAPNGFWSQTLDEPTIERWWREEPDANPASAFDAHTLVLDVDDTAKAKPVTDLLPKTGPVQITGGATDQNPKHHRVYHLNGYAPDGLITRIADLGIETKGLLKGYVLLAPSTTTGPYVWRRTGPSDALPASLHATLTTKRPKERAKAPDEPFIRVDGGPCANWCDTTGPIPRDPGGYQHLNDFAFHRVTYHRDTQPDAILDALLPLLARMSPPYPSGEGVDLVHRVTEQIVRDIKAGKIGPDGTWTQGSADQATGGGIGSRTANDLPIGPPPDLIVDGFLLPDKTTLFYGTGGTGKGVLAAIITAILVRDHGLVVGVIDYENHPEEWGSRLDGITFADGTRLTPDEKARIHYRSPYDIEDWAATTGSLHKVAMALRADFDAVGVDYAVVDSYSAATDGEEGMGGQRDAKNFAVGLTKIGRPALVLAHVAASNERLPDKPFGSIHVRNLVARLMYALAQDAPDEAPATAPLIAPTTIRVEAKRTKGNQYGRRANRWIEITFHPGGAITWDLDAKGAELPLWQQVETVLLAVAPEPLSPEAITKAVAEDFPGDSVLKVAHVRNILTRHGEVFVVVDGSSRPKRWSVRGSRVKHSGPPREGPDASLRSAASSEASSESERSTERSTGERGAKHSAQHGFEDVSEAWSERGAKHREPRSCVDPKAHGRAMTASGVYACRTCQPSHFDAKPPQPQ